MLDKIKLIIAVLLVGVAIGGFYYYSEESVLYRVLGLLVVMAISAGIVYSTELGKKTWSYFGDVRMEARKVVWPTRKETTQTTLMVMVAVIIAAGILSLFDWSLSEGVKLLTGQNG